MLKKIISGGQTGVDIAALRAAKSLAIETGGFMPKGFLTVAGPRPGYAAEFGLMETDSPDYPVRTRKNVQIADATLFIGAQSRGLMATRGAAWGARKPFLQIHPGDIWITPNVSKPSKTFATGSTAHRKRPAPFCLFRF